MKLNLLNKILLAFSVFTLSFFNGYILGWFLNKNLPKQTNDSKILIEQKDAVESFTTASPYKTKKSSSEGENATTTEKTVQHPRYSRDDNVSSPQLSFREIHPVSQHPSVELLKESEFFEEIANMNYYSPLANGDCFYIALIFLIFDNIKNENDPFFIRLFNRTSKLNFENASFEEDDFLAISKMALKIFRSKSSFQELSTQDLTVITAFLRLHIYLNRLNHEESRVHLDTSGEAYKNELKSILIKREYAYIDYSYDVAEILDCNVLVYCSNQDVSAEYSRHNFDKERTLRFILHSSHFYAVVP